MFSDVQARGLISGETVVAFVGRHTVSEGDELAITASHVAEPATVKPAYARWSGEELPAGAWVAVVEAVHPATLLDPGSGSSRHLFTEPGEGDLAILRVFDGAKPVMSDVAFAAMVQSIEGALTGG